MPTAFRVGQKLKAFDGKEGIARYIGPLHFTDGEWIGLELSEPLGKNNGTVRGETYFVCQENHGIFYKASTDFEVIEEPKPNAKSGVPASKARPSSIGLSSTRPRPSSIAATAKRTSTVTGTATAAQTPGRRQNLMPPPSTTATTRTSRLSLAPRTASPTKKPSTYPSRQSFVGVSAAVSRTTSQSPTKPPTSQAKLDGVIRTPLPSVTAKHLTPTARADATSARTALSSRTKAVEEEAKNKVLEKQLEKGRAENKERLRELEQLREENGRYKDVNEKLQTKCKTQHQEITELRKQLKETEGRFEQIEGIQAEHDSLMELAALDREMAEEKAEVAQAELDSVKQKLEELELEVEILKEENEELSKDMSPEERASQGWLQMQRENERLRDQGPRRG